MFSLARLIGRRFGPLGYAMFAYALWRRLPKRQRERIVAAVRGRTQRVRDSAGPTSRPAGHIE
jgi:hypothetical protein